MRFHDLRHSAATLLLAMEVHIKVVQELLGHSNVLITLNTCRVGGQRVAVIPLDQPEDASGGFIGRYVSNRPPPNRTCTFQRIRLSGATVCFS